MIGAPVLRIIRIILFYIILYFVLVIPELEGELDDRAVDEGRGPGVGGLILMVSRAQPLMRVQYTCTLHFCSPSTRCWAVL